MEKRQLPQKRGRRQSNARARQKQLLQAALIEFVEKGFHATRIEDIILQAKLGKGTFYLYFKDKEEIFAALLDILIDEINKILEWAFEELKHAKAPEQVFAEEARRIFKTLKKHKDIARLLFREGRAVSIRIEDKIENFRGKLIKTTSTNLQSAIDLQLLPMFNAQIAAVCIIGAVENVCQLWLEGKLKKIPQKEILGETLTFLLRGCGIAIP